MKVILKKFRMKSFCNLNFLHGLFVNYLYFSGWYYIIFQKKISKCRVLLGYIPSLTAMFIFPFYPVSQAMSIFYKSYDLGSASEVISMLMSMFAVQIKMFTLLFQVQDFAELSVLLQGKVLKFNSKKEKCRAEVIMEASVKRTNRCTLLFILISLIPEVIWLGMPLVPHFIGQSQNSTDGVKLLPGWYPFNYTRAPGSHIAFTYEVTLALFCGFFTITSNTLFYQLTLILCGHIEVLRYSFSNIHKTYRLDEHLITNTGKGKMVYLRHRHIIVSSLAVQINDEDNKNLTSLTDSIKNHQSITRWSSNIEAPTINEVCLVEILEIRENHLPVVKLAKKLSSVYSIFVATDILSALFLICLILFQITSVPEKQSVPDMFKLGSYLFGSSTMLFMVCWIGSELQSKSLELNESVYMSDWYCSPVKFKKMLPTIMLMSQRNLSLTAGHTFTANLNLFTKGMRVAYSFYTVLVNAYEPN